MFSRPLLRLPPPPSLTPLYSTSSADRRLANIDAILAAASKIVLDAHPWPEGSLSGFRVRSGGPVMASSGTRG
jgi:hypothetical protein